MGIRDNLNQSMRKDAAAKKRKPGSKAYNRHFEGYTKVLVPRANGRGARVEYVYTGSYHSRELPTAQNNWLRAGYGGLLVLAAGLFLWAGVQQLPGNSLWLVTLVQAAAVAALAWLAVATLHTVTVRQNYTAAEYHSGPVALRRASLAAAAVLGVLALVAAVATLVLQNSGTGRELLGALCYLLAGGGAAAIYLLEKRMAYVLRPSTAQLPAEGEVIE